MTTSPKIPSKTPGKRPGSALRDKVAGVLRVIHRDVQIEYPLKSTTADVYFVDRRSEQFPTRIAVECKDWNAGLSSSQLAAIDNSYRPSINGDEIDYLWIVSNHELSQGPSQTLSALRRVVYSTYQEFLARVMNFSLLLEDNIGAFQNHDSSKNFLILEVKGRPVTLEAATRDWISSAQRALVIFGGYGLGKTSFSLYIASTLSREYQNGTFDRIPIRISLSGLYAKQDLKGLICSVLTGAEGGPNVGNFSYNLFLKMVHEGLFILILDGFDEMRHAMSVEEFTYTFEQMSPLFSGNSKTVVLGRPDSFFNDEEEDEVFFSLFSEDDSHDARYLKIEVAPLRPTQISEYLTALSGRTKVSARKSGSGGAVNLTYDEDEMDILSRPVQLQMFTKIMRRHRAIDGKITRHRLYSSFIYEFLRREQGKDARKIDIGNTTLGRDDPRSIFMQRVAWWVLVEKRENRFSASEIPRDLVPATLAEGGQDAKLASGSAGRIGNRENLPINRGCQYQGRFDFLFSS